MIKTFLIAITVCICSLQPTSVYAQAVSAKAVVNGKLKIEFEREEAAVGKGVSIAAGKIFNPVKESYRVSSQPAPGDDGNQSANAKEVENLQNLINSIKGGDTRTKTTRCGYKRQNETYRSSQAL